MTPDQRWVKRSQSDREMDRSVDERTTFKRPGESFKVRGPVIPKDDKNLINHQASGEALGPTLYVVLTAKAYGSSPNTHTAAR